MRFFTFRILILRFWIKIKKDKLGKLGFQSLKPALGYYKIISRLIIAQIYSVFKVNPHILHVSANLRSPRLQQLSCLTIYRSNCLSGVICTGADTRRAPQRALCFIPPPLQLLSCSYCLLFLLYHVLHLYLVIKMQKILIIITIWL